MMPLLLIPGFLSDNTVWQDPAEALHDICDITIANLFGADSVDKMIGRISREVRHLSKIQPN